MRIKICGLKVIILSGLHYTLATNPENIVNMTFRLGYLKGNGKLKCTVLLIWPQNNCWTVLLDVPLNHLNRIEDLVFFSTFEKTKKLLTDNLKSKRNTFPNKNSEVEQNDEVNWICT